MQGRVRLTMDYKKAWSALDDPSLKHESPIPFYGWRPSINKYNLEYQYSRN